jgi:hypothetical protein
MMKSRLSRVAALEARAPADQTYSGFDAAIGRCHDALYRALPPDPGVKMPSATYSHAYSTVGYVPSSTKILELGRRLRAGTETAEDLTVLAALPADALAVVEVDARGFVEMLLSLDEKM